MYVYLANKQLDSSINNLKYNLLPCRWMYHFAIQCTASPAYRKSILFTMQVQPLQCVKFQTIYTEASKQCAVFILLVKQVTVETV